MVRGKLDDGRRSPDGGGSLFKSSEDGAKSSSFDRHATPADKIPCASGSMDNGPILIIGAGELGRGQRNLPAHSAGAEGQIQLNRKQRASPYTELALCVLLQP